MKKVTIIFKDGTTAEFYADDTYDTSKNDAFISWTLEQR